MSFTCFTETTLRAVLTIGFEDHVVALDPIARHVTVRYPNGETAVHRIDFDGSFFVPPLINGDDCTLDVMAELAARFEAAYDALDDWKGMAEEARLVLGPLAEAAYLETKKTLAAYRSGLHALRDWDASVGEAPGGEDLEDEDSEERLP